MIDQPKKFLWSRSSIVTLVALTVAISITLAGGAYAAASIWPSIGAQNADVLRGLIGDRAVAQLETMVLGLQDTVQQWEYQLGLVQPAALWSVTPATTLHSRPIKSAPTAMPLALAVRPSPTAMRFLPTPTATPRTMLLSSTVRPSATATRFPPTPTPTPTWYPMPIPPSVIGPSDLRLPGEAHWCDYLQNPTGQTVAYRAFIRPDPDRAYAVAAIVAFDLRATRLHIVLGSKEPQSPVTIRRVGRIPPKAMKSGLLLAAFNGGFKARHGHFGIMVNGVTVLPPREGLGTIALYRNGQVRIGKWGTEITPSPDVLAWRQNCPLIIHNGQVNPHTVDHAPQVWGYTVKGAIAVWRSGIGISADGHTLYYVAGRSLTLPALARTLALVGAHQAMQLDINNYWVHFDAVRSNGATLQTTPLFKAMKSQNDNRYLSGYGRDFFYVTFHGDKLSVHTKIAVVAPSKR